MTAPVEKIFTAYHEAGHAVIDCRLGFDVISATIKPGARYAGQVRSKWQQSTPRPIADDIKSLLAGEIAEHMVTIPVKQGLSSDRRQIRKLAKELCDSAQEQAVLIKQMRQETMGLVLQNKAAIERVADALLARQTLTGDEIRTIIARVEAAP